MRFSQRIPVVIIAVAALVLINTHHLTPPHSPQIITDHVGRSIPIPHRIEKVYATSQSGSLLIYALDPNLLLGWNTALSPEMEFILGTKAGGLPVLGTWNQLYQTADLDQVAGLKPDLVVHLAAPDLPNLDLAERIEDELGIPSIVVDGSLEAVPLTLRWLGELFGCQIRAQALALFAENTLTRLELFRDNLDSNPISVHIIGDTAKIDLDALALAGVTLFDAYSMGHADQVLIIPDPIRDLSREIMKNPPPGAQHALIEGAVYELPTVPQNWLTPNSILRLLGVEWLAQTAYPHIFNEDLAAKFQEFMEVFYEVRVPVETAQLIANQN